jgi:hypothetical protein
MDVSLDPYHFSSAIATGSTNTGDLMQKDKRQRIVCLSPDYGKKDTDERDEIHSHIDEHRNSQKKMNLEVTQFQRKPPWIDVSRSNSETKQVIHSEGAGIRNFHGLECAPNLSAEQKDATNWNSIGTSKSQTFEPSKSNGSEKINSSSSSSSNNNSNRSSMIVQHGITVPNVNNYDVEVRLDERAKAMSIANDSDTLYTPQRIQNIIPELDIGNEDNSTRGPSVIISPLSSCKPSPIRDSEKGLSVVEFLFFYVTNSIIINIKLINNNSIIHDFSDVI